MAIVSSLPFALTNGTTADATQVQANFNQLVSNVNANAAENGVNSSITQMTGLTTPLSITQGGTGGNTQTLAQNSLGLGLGGYIVSDGSGNLTLSTVGLAPNGSGAVTQSGTDSTTKFATTAQVQAAIVASGTIKTIVVQKFPSSGTYTVTAGMKYAIVRGVGGGGGGGGYPTTGSNDVGAGSGGGGGGFTEKLFTAAGVGSSQTVTIGSGGAAGGLSANGSTGGVTSFGSLLTCNGGLGGVYSVAVNASGGGNFDVEAGGLGGTATGGDINIQGQAGGNSVCGGAPGGGFGTGGDGGSSPLGNGGRGGKISRSGSGGAAQAPTGYGAGGGGSASTNSGVNYIGTAGTTGYLEVIEFCV